MVDADHTKSSGASDLQQELRAELEQTRRDFHQLLSQIPADKLDAPSTNPAWTIREVLYHMSLAPRNLPADVRMIRHLKRVPRIPAGPFNRLNTYLTRRGARNLDKSALADRYDQAHQRTMQALDSIQEEEWDFGVQYPDWDPMLSGFVTIERLFHYIRQHYIAHAEEVLDALDSEQ